MDGEPLGDEARLLELAQRLGQVGQSTLQSANEIFQTAQDLKKKQQIGIISATLFCHIQQLS